MGKRKLAHFAEMKSFSCVFEPDNEAMRSEEHRMKGNWRSDYFKNQNPLTLELGCGKGEYTLALARMFPNRNFVGIDIKGARMWRGSKTAETEGLKNVAFLRTKIEFIENFFAPREVNEIWLTFSDPQPKDKKGTKRLTGSQFLARYRNILTRDGRIHVKSDSPVLYEKTLETLSRETCAIDANTDDLYGKGILTFPAHEQEVLNVRTFYEQKWLKMGKKIHYLRFTLK